MKKEKLRTLYGSRRVQVISVYDKGINLYKEENRRVPIQEAQKSRIEVTVDRSLRKKLNGLTLER